MKRIIAITVATGLLCITSGVFANNTTVNWGAQVANGVGDAGGNPLPNGSNDLILLGSFNISNATITANGSNESFLMSHFTTFASATIGQGNPNGAGSASDGYWTGLNTASASGLGIQNTEVYYWIFNSTAANTASQYGIFTLPSNANWTFPDDSSNAQQITNDLSQVPHNSTGILWGSYGTGLSRDDVDPLYNLAAIPEPATTSLIALGVIGLAFSRRRKA